jgi:predicted phosphoribosyltransferase/pimeloyl-ACP methyl ester carboxylesterase
VAPNNNMFANRADAARQLAAALSAYRGSRPLVLAIPRGGVPVGRIVADALGGELDIVLVRKLSAPFDPEFALGAVDEQGRIHLPGEFEAPLADSGFIQREVARELAVIRERRNLYGGRRPPADPVGRTVIVVDDGLATGATMRAALSAVRAQTPHRLVCALPVAAQDSLPAIRPLCDDLVCLRAPRDFHAVGQYYQDFHPVGDEEVVAMLQRDAPGERASGSGIPTSIRSVRIRVGDAVIVGDLEIPSDPRGLVIFAHGSGSSRMSPRNRFVAHALNRDRFATLLCDLLTEDEDRDPARRFDIPLLADRISTVVDWAGGEGSVRDLPVGLFGASTGAAAALIASVRQPRAVKAVVSRGGRPDLAGRSLLSRVTVPVLLIVGGADDEVLALNREAQAQMAECAALTIIPGATHLFEEAGALEAVAELAAQWFGPHLAGTPATAPRPPQAQPGLGRQ